MAVSYSRTAQTIRTPSHRLIRHREKGQTTFIELYDHQAADGETTNIADKNPEIVESLVKQLDGRLKKELKP